MSIGVNDGVACKVKPAILKLIVFMNRELGETGTRKIRAALHYRYRASRWNEYAMEHHPEHPQGRAATRSREPHQVWSAYWRKKYSGILRPRRQCAGVFSSSQCILLQVPKPCARVVTMDTTPPFLCASHCYLRNISIPAWPWAVHDPFRFYNPLHPTLHILITWCCNW